MLQELVLGLFNAEVPLVGHSTAHEVMVPRLNLSFDQVIRYLFLFFFHFKIKKPIISWSFCNREIFFETRDLILGQQNYRLIGMNVRASTEL